LLTDFFSMDLKESNESSIQYFPGSLA